MKTASQQADQRYLTVATLVDGERSYTEAFTGRGLPCDCGPFLFRLPASQVQLAVFEKVSRRDGGFDWRKVP